jgi:hypothetical protein
MNKPHQVTSQKSTNSFCLTFGFSLSTVLRNRSLFSCEGECSIARAWVKGNLKMLRLPLAALGRVNMKVDPFDALVFAGDFNGAKLVLNARLQ